MGFSLSEWYIEVRCLDKIIIIPFKLRPDPGEINYILNLTLNSFKLNNFIVVSTLFIAIF